MKVIKYLYLAMFTIALLPAYSLAQQLLHDSAGAATQILQRNVEDAAIATAVEPNADYSVLTETLERLLRRPLELNRATAEELALLPGVSLLLAESIVQHRIKFGAFVGLYELQAVSGMTRAVFDRMRPFIQVAPQSELEVGSEGLLHRVPTLAELRQELRTQGQWELTQRISRDLQLARGYTLQGDAQQRYLGDPYRVFTRLRYRTHKHFQAGIVLEKDPGERFAINTNRQQFGYDYMSAHLALQNYGRLQHLVLGDYTLHAGQGLVFSRGLGFARGGEAVTAARVNATPGLQPYLATNENTALRGMAATVAITPTLSIMGLYSATWRDASSSADTTDAEAFSSILRSGLHRTQTELENRATLHETMVGGRLAYTRGPLSLGTTHAYVRYNRGRTIGTELYEQYAFTGVQDLLLSVDGHYTIRNVHVFGEVARSANLGGSYAAVLGALASLAPRVDVALQVRHFDAGFHTLRGFTVAQRAAAINNERGILLALTVRPAIHWQLNAYLDQYETPAYRYRVSTTAQGYDALVQLHYQPRRTLGAYLRYRTEADARDVPLTDATGNLARATVTQRNSLRLHVDYDPGQKLSLTGRAEAVRWQHAEVTQASGWMLWAGATYKVTRQWRLSVRGVLFNLPVFDVRLYAYEPDVPTAFSLPAYTSAGQRLVLLLHYQPAHGLTRRWDVWLRFAQTSYPGRASIGSGLELASGSLDTEVKVQLRYRWGAL